MSMLLSASLGAPLGVAAPLLPRTWDPSAVTGPVDWSAMDAMNRNESEVRMLDWDEAPMASPSCKVLSPAESGADVSMLELSRNVPAADSLPRSWKSAQLIPSDPADQDCGAKYSKSRLAFTFGMCCCTFWSDVPGFDKVDLSRKQRQESCDKEFPAHPPVELHAAQKGAASKCRFAVALSGYVSNPDTVPCVLESMEKHVIVDEQVCAVAYLETSSSLVDAVRSTIASKPWMLNYVVEASDQEASEKDAAVAECTGGAFEDFFDRAGETLDAERFGSDAYDKVKGTFRHMHRKIWLAQRMARRLDAPLELIARMRVDGVPQAGKAALQSSGAELLLTTNSSSEPSAADFKMDWERVKRRSYVGGAPQVLVQDVMTNGPLGTRHVQHSRGVPTSMRCWADDEFAIGPPDLMDDYSSMYPDFQMMLPYVPIYSEVLPWGTAERLLANHLHLRGVRFDTSFDLPYKFSTTIRGLCNGYRDD